MVLRINPATAKQIAVCVTVSLVLSACSPTNSAAPGLEPTRAVATVNPASAADVSVAATEAPVDTSSSPSDASPTEAAPSSVARATDRPRATAAAALAPLEPLAPSCTEVKPALTDASTPSPEVIPAAGPSGQIVYLTGDGNIALTDATGSITSAVTSDAFIDEASQTLRVYQFPTFSNDGASLAFVEVDANGATSNFTQTVHVAAAKDKPTVATLYETTVSNIPYLDWSPDSSKLAFLTIAQAKGAIRLVSPSGGPISTLDIGSSAYWHWRNDSTAIVAHLGGAHSASSDAHIAVIDTFDLATDTSQVTRLESLPGQFQAPQFSPNGKFMLYVAGLGAGPTSDVNDLILADAAGKPVCTVTRMESGAFFAWSPSGAQIAYLDTQSPLQLPRPLTILDLETGKRVQVDRDGIMFFWSPSGNRLALYSIFDLGTGSSSQSNGGGVLSAPASARANAPAQQSQKVLRIEMIDAGTGKAVKVADTLPTRDMGAFFQFFDQYSRAMTPWSPDGRSLVFVSAASSAATADIGVATLSPSGSSVNLTHIATGSMAFWSPK